MKSLFSVLLLFVGCVTSVAAKAPETFQNPILSGYHPDPSICRVGDDYYLVNSTFVWFPGIPIYHSKDLVNWKLVGHGVHRPEQLDFDGLIDKFGIFAVTIRHHKDTFYLITTLVGKDGGNFYITAEDPAGPWSDPIWLKDAPGIDPSLMWDDDGKCYYTGQKADEPEEFWGDCVVWTQELDLEKQQLVGERWVQASGHAVNAEWTEGPHLYKINGKYMIMHSEGGTGPFHALVVHHADNKEGPFEADMINPVLSHRHFGRNEKFQAIGHGDLVQTQNGEWWCVLLGKRVFDGQTTLARETLLAKVDFEGQTPIFNNGSGRVFEEQLRPDLPWTPVEKAPARDEFQQKELDLKWCTIRVPKESYYQVKDNDVVLDLLPAKASELKHFSVLLQRVEHHHFSAKTKIDFETKADNEHAGLAVYRTNENYYLLLKEKDSVVLVKSFKGEKEEVARIPFTSESAYLAVEGDYLNARFFVGENENELSQIGDDQSLIVIADGNGNQFNGAGVGMYASSNGQKSNATATFDWFEYRPVEIK